MKGFMIYFVINMRLFKMFKVFFESGPSWEKSGKMGKKGCPRIPIILLLITEILLKTAFNTIQSI